MTASVCSGNDVFFAPRRVVGANNEWKALYALHLFAVNQSLDLAVGGVVGVPNSTLSLQAVVDPVSIAVAPFSNDILIAGMEISKLRFCYALVISGVDVTFCRFLSVNDTFIAEQGRPACAHGWWRRFYRFRMYF